MEFYYRSLPQGRCEVVCTRCFMSIGEARDMQDIWRVENSHHCLSANGPARRPALPVQKPQLFLRSLYAQDPLPRPACFGWSNAGLIRKSLLLIAVALSLYGLPKILEFAALRSWNPWIAVVLPGDLAGCACLVLVFRKVRAGILLYCLLTSIEACLYLFHLAPARALSWAADLIPTLIVSWIFWRSQGGLSRLIPIS